MAVAAKQGKGARREGREGRERAEVCVFVVVVVSFWSMGGRWPGWKWLGGAGWEGEVAGEWVCWRKLDGAQASLSC